MKAIMIMYDSLNRKYLEPYGCSWTLTPNFSRLAQRCVQFENCYAGSMPCMPARRELHTGRYNFLHRSWGPLEPFDDSMPEILKENGIYTHLISDHQHYWEDGGCTYHTRYSSWEISRGQEGDPWKADLRITFDKDTFFKAKKPLVGDKAYREWYAKDERNRAYMNTEARTSQAVTFESGIQFIRQHHAQDDWFLQIETFDPHEPFFTLPDDKALYPHQSAGDCEDDWPPYAEVAEDSQTVQHVRFDYAALVSKCDRYLGKILDLMDQYDLWKDTMLIVNTDHGFLLGEHGWWGKTVMPMYDEIAHTPLFLYDPRLPECGGEHRCSIVQTIDLAPSLLEFFGVEIPHGMQGKPLYQVVKDDSPVRDCAVSGYHGSQIVLSDGRYVYMRSASDPDAPVFEYTLMPTHMRCMFSPEELSTAELSGPFSFTKGCRVLKIKAENRSGDTTSFGTRLYDLQTDPEQNTPIDNEKVRECMESRLQRFFDENEAPEELYERFGLKR